MPKPWRAPDGSVVDRCQQVYVATRGEEWRIDAFTLLRDVMDKSGRNEALERLEGSLLGYEEWQDDWWIEHKRRNRRGAEMEPAGHGRGPDAGWKAPDVPLSSMWPRP